MLRSLCLLWRLLLIQWSTHSLCEGLLIRMGSYFDSVFGNKLQVIFGAIAAFFISIWGMAGAEGQEVILLVVGATICLFVGDIILGVLIAIRQGVFSSKGFGRALEKLVVYGLVVTGMTSFGVIVAAIPCATGIAVPTEIIIASARGFFMWTLILISMTEFISIVENLRTLGFSLPQQVYDLIDEVNKRIGRAVPGVEVDD